MTATAKPLATAIELGNAGNAYYEQGRMEEAAASYQRALELSPDYAEAHNNLGATRRAQGKLDEAVLCCQRALELRPDYAEAHNNMGLVLSDKGRLDEAVVCYRRALELRPVFAAAHCNLGTYQLQAGIFDEAERSWREALRHDPAQTDALARLAELLGGKLPAEDFVTLRRLASETSLTDDKRSRLQFGLAHVLDAQGDYSGAAAQLSCANSLALAEQRRQGKVYDPGAYERFVTAVIDTFSSAYFERVKGYGSESERPVFIFGLPRSGTTLTEQILAGHSQVLAAGELEFIGAAFESLPPLAMDVALARLARQYLDMIARLDEKALRVVDKLPDNYVYLGLLTTMFPRAKLIHCRRDLRDVAVSCWMTNFRQIAWASHYEHIASRIHAYRRLMDHWRRVLPTTVLEVDYDDTVADLEGTARRLVDWCGLSWEPRCLAFHERRQAVRTASATQVRRPIYRHAVGRWKHYEQALAPLFALL